MYNNSIREGSDTLGKIELLSHRLGSVVDTEAGIMMEVLSPTRRLLKSVTRRPEVGTGLTSSSRMLPGRLWTLRIQP